jgi:DNA-binding transcriptional regulator YiaG
MKQAYRSELDMVIHEGARALFEIGAIDEAEMREYDADCLVPAAPQSEPLSRGNNAEPAYAHA